MIKYKPLRPGEIPTRDHTMPIAVVDRLDDLHGPVTGTVTLPGYIDWTPPGTYDLDRTNAVHTMYETVLREAHREDDLTAWLDAGTLVELWPNLTIPAAIRQAWESVHPGLREC